MTNIARGGTELLMGRLIEAVPADLMSNFQIVPTRITEPLQEDKVRIAYIHDLCEDPQLDYLANGGWRKFHLLVFVSNWQMQSFINKFNIPWSRCVVIENSIVPIDKVAEVPKGKIKLIYTPTPHRGLNILLTAFQELLKTHDNLVLDVYSSFNLYGWDERDKEYEPLFEFCRNHPSINYHGCRPNREIREALLNSHIFAYPSIWTETSCQPKGTKILTKLGVKNIENITIGDEVLTHKGNFRAVYDTFEKNFKGDLVSIKAQGHYKNIMFTPEHLVFVGNKFKRSDAQGNHHYNNKIWDTLWVRADEINPLKHVLLRPKQKNMKSDYITVDIFDNIDNKFFNLDKDNNIVFYRDYGVGSGSRPVKNKLIVDEEFAFVVGLFCGDGHASSVNNSLSFSHHSKERGNAERLIKFFPNSKIYDISENEISTKIYSSVWSLFFQKTVGKKKEKKIPWFIFESPLSVQKAFIDGYYSADGHKTRPGGKKALCSISPSLAYGLKALLTTQGYFVSFTYFASRNCYTLTWREEPTKKFYNESDEYIGLRISEIERVSFDDKVYNFEVEEDHSYVTEGVAAHNCLCLIEAMSAGLSCVHPNLGALYETAANWTYQYQWQDDVNKHLFSFIQIMNVAIENVKNDVALSSRLRNQKIYTDQVHGWDHRKAQWISLLTQMKDIPREFEKTEYAFQYRT